jgi:hypothetical protein
VEARIILVPGRSPDGANDGLASTWAPDVAFDTVLVAADPAISLLG